MSTFNEAQHPRAPAGEPNGGEWINLSPLLGKDGLPMKVYHGSVSKGLASLDPNAPHVRPTSGPAGVYFTSDGMSANNYTRAPGASIKTPRGELLMANIGFSNALDITASVKSGVRRGLTFASAKEQALKKFNPSVHDGVIFRGNGWNPDEYVVTKSSQIRLLPRGIRL
jgi:hypothetical protein